MIGLGTVGKAAVAGGVIALVVATTVVMLMFVGDQGAKGEPFTEFYLLGPDGRAEGYPATLTVGQWAFVTVGIMNREGKEATYRIALLINGDRVAEIGEVELGPQERWEQPVGFTLRQAGGRQLVEPVLYLEGRSQPYRRLHLWVDGLEAVAPQEAGEESVPAEAEAPTSEDQEVPPPQVPTPEPEPQPTPEPQYEVHIVSRGENLTVIARRYGVSLQAVIEANSEIRNPNLIYSNQRILIPVEGR